MSVKILTAKEAVDLIKDDDAVVFGGFLGSVVPEELEYALGERYKKQHKPSNLTVIFAAGQGDGDKKALNQIAYEGLVGKVIGGHWGLVPGLQRLAIENKIQAYNLPQGIISHLYRDISAGKPGTISKVGLNTFVDPRLEGGRVNKVTTEDIVEVLNLGGEEYLFYKKFQINVALLRGTTADKDGNITMEDEAITICNQVSAAACHNSGGIVIVQVKQVVERGELNPQLVKIPGVMVDAVVVSSDDKFHMQTYDDFYDSRKVTQHSSNEPKKQNSLVTLEAKDVIARRAALELRKGSVVNFGIGVPEYIAKVTNQNGVDNLYLPTVEPGVLGGSPAGSLSFGTALYPQAIINQDYQFDFYDGGGLDQAFLGLAQADEAGNINVSRFGPRIAGCGGFINISQSAKEVYFCGTFTAKGLDINVADGALTIVNEGRQAKFIKQVEQITYSGKQAWETRQKVLYITERGVFSLNEKGLVLTEIAPGVDLQKDIVNQMAFNPQISPNLKEMDRAIFSTENLDMLK